MIKRQYLFLILLASLFVVNPVMAQDSVVQAQTPVATAVNADADHSGWVMYLINLYEKHMNYWTTGGLMAVESSFIPFPSEA